jgi:hypothetical protein
VAGQNILMFCVGNLSQVILPVANGLACYCGGSVGSFTQVLCKADGLL